MKQSSLNMRIDTEIVTKSDATKVTNPNLYISLFDLLQNEYIKLHRHITNVKILRFQNENESMNRHKSRHKISGTLWWCTERDIVALIMTDIVPKITNTSIPFRLRSFQNKANLRDLIAATSLVILFKIGFKSSIFWSMWPSNLMEDLEKQQSTFSVLHQALCIISNPLVNSNCSYSPETLNLAIFSLVSPWNFTDDLEKQKGTSSMLLQELSSIS